MKNRKKILWLAGPLSLLTLGTWYLIHAFTGSGNTVALTEERKDSIIVNQTKELLYGIPLTDFRVVEHVVKSGENFSSILNKNGISMELIQAVLDQSVDGIDLTRIIAGKSFHFFFPLKGDAGPSFFVYVPDNKKYIKADLTAGGKVEVVKKQVKEATSTLGGIISSSLYQAIDDQDKDVSLTYKIADVFKWSIDFFALQKGDKFKAVYKDQLIDSVSQGTGDILAAYFYHDGKEYYAIAFQQGDKTGFYDLEGNSMKSRFLQAPLEYTRISSGYSLNRYHPILKKSTPHLGIDYAAPSGTPIVTIADGTVIECGYKGGNGNYVKVKHDETYTTQYLHMSKFGTGIKKGVKVMQGEIIGYVGSTGLSTGPHLCFRFWKDGKQVDPTKETPQVTEPLQEAYKTEFLAYRDSILPMLQNTGYFDNVRQSSLKTLERVAGI